MSEYAPRQERNEQSRNRAEHHREPWADYELELLAEWDSSEAMLDDVAELLGRTREACRQEFYLQRSGQTRARVKKTVTSVTVTTVTWQDDDEWPAWYIRG